MTAASCVAGYTEVKDFIILETPSVLFPMIQAVIIIGNGCGLDDLVTDRFSRIL
jgi:hypothetical protein